MIKIAKKTAQQGDVLLVKINSFPPGKKKLISKNNLILALGEKTGHSHTIESFGGEMFTIDKIEYVALEEPATLKHQEHGAINLEPGIWQIGHVQEYDYFAQMKRPVID